MLVENGMHFFRVQLQIAAYSQLNKESDSRQYFKFSPHGRERRPVTEEHGDGAPAKVWQIV